MTTTTTTTEGPASPAAPAAGGSALGRLVGVFVSPVRTFASIATRPTWVLPVAISAGLAFPLSELVLSRVDWRAIATKQLASRHLSEAQIEEAVPTIRKIGWIAGDVVSLAGPFFVTLVVALVLWGACQAFGWEVRFRQSLGVTAHAFFPATLLTPALLVALWNRHTIDPATLGDALRTNLGFLVDPTTDRVLHSLASSLDLFSLWAMALLVLGLSFAANASRQRMAVLVISLWLLFVFGKAGAAALTAQPPVAKTGQAKIRIFLTERDCLPC